MNFVRRRNIAFRFPLAFVVFVVSVSASAQTSPEVDAAKAQEHLLKHVGPIYPAMAKAASAREIVLGIEIDQFGHGTTIKSLSGPSML